MIRMEINYLFFISLVTTCSSWLNGCQSYKVVLLSIPVCSVVLTSPSLLSSHSTHSSDEAGFNDPSLLENLQSNHVSNVWVPCHPPAVTAAVQGKSKKGFESNCVCW